MKKKIMKALSVMLAVVLTLTAAPLSGFVGLELPDWLDVSIEASAETSGSCGENLTWSFEETTGTLTISGTGAMYDYSYSTRPFQDFESNIVSLVINAGTTTIGNYAFYGLESLIDVTIPDGVTIIGDSSFYACKKLSSIGIPVSVTSIGSNAFSLCYTLTDIFIPANVESMVYSFENCVNLKSIIVDENNQYFSNDDYGVLFDKDKTILIKYPAGNTRTNYIVPNSVIQISDSSFL